MEVSRSDQCWRVSEGITGYTGDVDLRSFVTEYQQQVI